MRLPSIAPLLACSLSIAAIGRADAEHSPSPVADISWRSDYHEALEAAKEQGKFALLWFIDSRDSSQAERLERDVWSRSGVRELVAKRCIAIRLPTDAQVTSGGKEIALLSHPAFAEMQRSPGIAILDMTDESSPLLRQVVSVFPFLRRAITADELLVILDLPRGTLTQRTLIFAVRTHPERPASAASELSELLARETESHAAHQARIALQGHHQWAARFQSINAQLPPGLVAQEVCAESWPAQTLVEAAEECVDSWRHSSGHWDAVSRRHVLFGYDMKRGSNGVWYAAGIFARKM